MRFCLIEIMKAKPVPEKASIGLPFPLGTECRDGGVNFACFVEEEKTLTLDIYDVTTRRHLFSIPFTGKTGSIRHLFLEDYSPPFLYTLSLDGIPLLDPYAKSIDTPRNWGEKTPYFPFGKVEKEPSFDSSKDDRPSIPLEDLIIYEMHVRGFTNSPSSGVKNPGTFQAIIEKIPYLKELGINAVELLPVHEFNEREYIPKDKRFRGKLFQYWGYSPISYFALMNRFNASSERSTFSAFQELVSALHSAGIEVILDVVFNHTAEGGTNGPTYHFKALSKSASYLLDEEGGFENFSGCGNTIRANHQATLELILASLRYFVVHAKVDGFRFDLASTFYRDEKGKVLENPPILNAIANDPILKTVKLFAEPWDAAGLYQVGGFYRESGRFSEWNGKWRDAARRFLRGDNGLKGEFATRLAGSQDLYSGGSPNASIQFFTCHDGFSLADLVSYSHKHNLENGENDADGLNNNDSANYGVEGETDDKAILAIRERQMRNFVLALLVSQGIPMLLMGDEYGHKKKGNNNTWCQDNGLSWFDWNGVKQNHAFFRYYSGLVHFRKNNPLLKHGKFLSENELIWHGEHPNSPEWERENHLIAFSLKDPEHGNDIFVAFNAKNEKATIELPKPHAGKKWHLIVNTSNPPPADFYEEKKAPLIKDDKLTLLPFSSILLKML